MYAYELFRKLNAEKIVEEMVNCPYFFSEIDYDNRLTDKEKEEAKQQYKELCIEEIVKINDLNISPNKDKIIFVSTAIANEDTLTTYIMNTKAIDKIIEAFQFKNIDDFKNPLYGVTFMKRSDILAVSISKENIEKYGEYKTAALILKECLAFRLDDKERNEFIDSVMMQLTEMDNESFENCKTADEVFEELREEFGFEKEEETEEEKEQREIQLINQITNDLEILKKDVMKIIDNLEK